MKILSMIWRTVKIGIGNLCLWIIKKICAQTPHKEQNPLQRADTIILDMNSGIDISGITE